MFNEIVENIKGRIKNQPDSRCATDDEVRICWLVSEINELREKVKAAENCLVCSAIADPMEVIQNTMEILKTKNNKPIDTKPCSECRSNIRVQPGVFYCQNCGRALS